MCASAGGRSLQRWVSPGCLRGSLSSSWLRHASAAANAASAKATQRSAPSIRRVDDPPPPAVGTLQLLREPTASISAHKGLKVQAALCVERPPLQVLEPDFKKRWLEFRESWEARTGNQLTVQDEIVFMKYHFHFFGDNVAYRALTSGGAARLAAGRGGGTRRGIARAGKSALSDALVPQSGTEDSLDQLLSGTGIDLAFPDQKGRATQRRLVQRKRAESVDDSSLRSLQRLRRKSLYLVVRYRDAPAWTFPKADRPHGMAMREVLLRLCESQMGPNFEPYLVGACPFAYRKRLSGQRTGINGRKVFYYRARLPPGMDARPPSDGSVADWAWCSREELPQRIRDGEWRAVRDGLPLDELSLAN
mmetsp:Transcript_4378/g.8769  ORF Transcript_4378/g.8769 Transcript_4378/m.8769 type:complete len:363 (+) Transcript_4378:59-1147(+)